MPLKYVEYLFFEQNYVIIKVAEISHSTCI